MVNRRLVTFYFNKLTQLASFVTILPNFCYSIYLWADVKLPLVNILQDS